MTSIKQNGNRMDTNLRLALHDAILLMESEAKQFHLLDSNHPGSGWDEDADAYDEAARLIRGLL